MALSLDQAIEKARSLDWRAAEGWPLGYDAAKIRAEVMEVDAAICAAEAKIAAPARAAWARRVVERIERKEFTATVRPRRRRSPEVA